MVCGGMEYSIKELCHCERTPWRRQDKGREAIPRVMEETAHLHCTERTIC